MGELHIYWYVNVQERYETLVQDLRDLTKSIMRVHHPTSVRSVVFSPSYWQPLQAVAGLDNGSIYR